ncbi:hypothetical protein AB0G74_16630 [Streptomyces sp. NPDC020875]|uniref:hypothetical protein n=1 Tax=Streptomyces sp. NPDC020875 TaxID=3154898 RepID=UPI0033F114E1
MLRRRITAAVGVLTSAGALVLGMTGPAHAAQGDIRNSGWHEINPSGCVEVPRQDNQFVVHNYTNEYALVYQTADCKGPVIEVIPPGGSSTDTSRFLGRAVFLK